MITVTTKDVLRNKTVTPGVYDAYCSKVTPGVAKDSGASLFLFEIVIEGGPFDGVPLKDFMVSEKAPGMGIKFFEVCMGSKIGDDGITFDENNCVGKKFRVKVKHDLYNNRIQNVVEEFLPRVA